MLNWNSYTQGADSGALLKIGNSLRKYPELSLKSGSAYTQKTAELIAKHHKVLGAGKAALLAMMEQDLKDTGQCRLYLAKKPWGENKPAFGLPKFTPIVLIFSYEYQIYNTIYRYILYMV